MRRRLAAVVVALSALGTAGPALANGRYPSAQQLAVDPGDPSRLWLRATYGILTSADAGATWRWICESLPGYGAGEDPMLVVTADGAVLAATAQGLVVTRDHGCTWEHQPDIADRYVLDLATESNPDHVVALTNVVQQNSDYDLVVWRSADGGRSFQTLGPPISQDLVGLTIDVAPSDPARIYVSALALPPRGPVEAGAADAGANPGAAVLMRSRDGGSTWERKPVPGTSIEAWPLVAAVHPTRPDTVYVRVRGPNVVRGFIESWLLVTETGGDTWKEIFRGSADLLGFALAGDGSAVLAGLGDPFDANIQRKVDPAALGLYRQEGATGAFTRVFSGQVGCLTERDGTLYVCGAHASQKWELGTSTDLGTTTVPLLDFGPEIAGPILCPGGNAAAQECTAQWTESCKAMNACGGAPILDAGPPPSPKEKGGGGGCGCRVPAAGGPGGGATALLLAALLARLRGRGVSAGAREQAAS